MSSRCDGLETEQGAPAMSLAHPKVYWSGKASLRRGVLTAVRAAALVAATSTAASPVGARTRRRRFEPTDLELERAGTMELDGQVGVIGGGPARVEVPDFELDLGLTSDLEVDVDGAFALTRRNDDGTGPLVADPDNLWISGKTALVTLQRDDTEDGLTVGLQLGPKLPTGRGAAFVGCEGLVLAGARVARWQATLSAGGLWDPRDAGGHRPLAAEGGIDVEAPLRGPLSLAAEAGLVHFFTEDPEQISASAGLTWAVGRRVDLSAAWFVGRQNAHLRSGGLIGLAPRLDLW